VFSGKLRKNARILRYAQCADGIAPDVEYEQLHGVFTGFIVTTVVPGAVVGSGVGSGVAEGVGVVSEGRGVGVSASFGVTFALAVSS
jgi:hypothetical protein